MNPASFFLGKLNLRTGQPIGSTVTPRVSPSSRHYQPPISPRSIGTVTNVAGTQLGLVTAALDYFNAPELVTTDRVLNEDQPHDHLIVSTGSVQYPIDLLVTEPEFNVTMPKLTKPSTALSPPPALIPLPVADTIPPVGTHAMIITNNPTRPGGKVQQTPVTVTATPPPIRSYDPAQGDNIIPGEGRPGDGPPGSTSSGTVTLKDPTHSDATMWPGAPVVIQSTGKVFAIVQDQPLANGEGKIKVTYLKNLGLF
jgi:hypothetical protein